MSGSRFFFSLCEGSDPSQAFEGGEGEVERNVKEKRRQREEMRGGEKRAKGSGNTKKTFTEWSGK